MLGVSVGLSPWRKEALRTTLWVVPLVLLAGAVVLFLVTYDVDSRVYRHGTVVPSWVRIESADGARQLLSALAAGVITVLGVVFSVTIVALTLASQQFGPRMLRNFIRDFGAPRRHWAVSSRRSSMRCSPSVRSAAGPKPQY